MNTVLFITNKIPHYRLPLYEMLGKYYNLTIAHTGVEVQSLSFDEIILRESKLGPFQYFSGTVYPEKYDVVVIYLNARLINLYQLLFWKRSFKLIVFGIGVSASYTKKYDSDKLIASITKRLVSRADAAIFYDDYPIIKYSSCGVDPRKLFVAYNTVKVVVGKKSSKPSRNSLLFIGSIYRQKGLGQLLEAYTLADEEHQDLPLLNIVGDGPDMKDIETEIAKKNLHEKVHLLGRITDDLQLKQYFDQAMCCVSPGQAGLSVQKAFAFGVPFLTSYYPISGGEFTSIIEGVTGFYYDGTTTGLLKKIIEIQERDDLEKVYQNCEEFYRRFRSPEVWLNGFKGAIEFVLKEN